MPMETEVKSCRNVPPARNISISEVITNIRIDAACKMLETSSLSLKEISDKCGYANQYYFSTTFKKKKNMTPSAYRDLSGIPS